jgi:NADH pyrophosphatase NudC (nudix superfamily)
MYSSLHLLLVLVVPLGVAYLMVLMGMGKTMLEWKHPVRFCPSCGLDERRCRCRD